MRLRWIAIGALTTTLLLADMRAISAAQAARAPDCEPGWHQTGTGLVDLISRRFSTRPDIAGNPRGIQFRVLSVRMARYTYSNCQQSRVRYFRTASQYRLWGRGGIGGWVNYTRPPGTLRGWRWPDMCAGWDPVASVWLRWSC